jgi:hypothetical protein
MNTLTTSSALPVKRIPRFRLSLPVLLLWLLLLPFGPLLLLALLIVCAVYAVNPFRAAAALFRLFAGLNGTRVEVQTREVSIVVSLF